MAGSSRILVWDGALRLFHWSTVLLVAAMWWSAENHMMDWHRRMGMILVGLVTFRLAWGLLGPRTARFTSWQLGPGAMLGYLKSLKRGVHKPSFGHNPIGTLSVIAMLAALCVQLGTGLFAVDVDGLESGPLSTLVSFEAGRQAAEIHEISFNILVALIGLHVAAVAVYLIFFKDNLVRPMVTGRRASADFEAGETLADNRLSWLRLAIAVAVAFAAMWGISTAG
ncbi:cytochrome b/b6 domain-containing protein [Hyphomonas sp.]|uniref:cytochrome b/b6 domain-containing protein n=1 Tax=Hyphomonas sp. TaxID=87 RepID=UPI000C5B1AB2|nr:cytochrome b/b6 domain-containing protein [Hyphomonas sp.]MAB11460.1 Ni/Fe-hydrogenase 1 b-type cytochrome subunit [Hyphomonas sp.]MAU65554.1 Ni/Fe-hydrogenase 1 b-type cytochrome subunit [Hyphomonas sp.]MBM59329.1 Ni/Fe-hydrogenase 1 b-type cytochrome subunit [Hyphomonas sp.]